MDTQADRTPFESRCNPSRTSSCERNTPTELRSHLRIEFHTDRVSRAPPRRQASLGGQRSQSHSRLRTSSHASTDKSSEQARGAALQGRIVCTSASQTRVAPSGLRPSTCPTRFIPRSQLPSSSRHRHTSANHFFETPIRLISHGLHGPRALR